MLLTVCMYVLEAVEVVLCEEEAKKMTTLQKLFTLLLSPIWPVVTLIKTQWKQFKYEAIPEDPREEKEEIEKLTQISNRAHLIEVSMESSLQPLVQLHVILSQFLKCGGEAGISWSQAMEVFWEKDLGKMFDLSQNFNPQVNQSSFLAIYSKIQENFACPHQKIII